MNIGLRTYEQFNKIIIVATCSTSGKNVLGWVSLDEEDARDQVWNYTLSFISDPEFKKEQMEKATEIYSESFNPT